MCAILFALGAWLGCFQLVNEDIGWQVATGNRMLQEGRIHFNDDFSYTANDEEYQPVHLAFYIVTALTHRALGDDGLILFKMLFGGVFALVVFAALRKRTPNHVLAFILALLVLALVRERWLVRPQLSSYTLFAAVFLILDKQRTLDIRRVLVLVVLFTVAANFHPGFIFALGAVGLFCLIGPLPLGRGIILAAACTLAGLLTPISPHHLSFLTEHTYRFDRLNIHEFVSAWPPQGYPVIWALLIVWLGVMFLDRFRGRKWQILTAAVFFGLGIWTIRFIPYAVMSSVATLPGAIDRIIGDRRRNNEAGAAETPPDRQAPSPVKTVLAVAAILAVTFWPWWPLPAGKKATYTPGFGWNELAMPVRAATFLDGIGFEGRISNYNTFGGFLILKGYPRWKVETDGRIQIYDWVYKYTESERYQAKPPDAIVYPRYSGEMLPPLFLKPEFRMLWGLVFMDEGAMVLLRRNGPYAHVVLERGAPHVGLPVPIPEGGGFTIGVNQFGGETEEEATARMYAELERIRRID